MLLHLFATGLPVPRYLNADPDPSFHLNADPDPHQSDANLRPLILNHLLLNFDFNADPDPAFLSTNADPDPAFQNWGMIDFLKRF